MMTRSIPVLLLAVSGLLLIPFIAGQFTDEVSWSGMDYLVMGTLLLVAGLGLAAVAQFVRKPAHRLMLGAAVVAVFLLLWAELAVGIFGTPLAGS